MTLWKRLQYLLPWHRRAAERDMQDELRSLAEIAGPRELGNLTIAAEDERAAILIEERCDAALDRVAHGFGAFVRREGQIARVVVRARDREIPEVLRPRIAGR